MRHEELPEQLRNLAFDFFSRFSRFEFALKEARILKDDRVGTNAEADWDGYIWAFRNQYVLSLAGKALVEARSQRQNVGKHELDFRNVAFNPDASGLEKVVRLTNTLRNNLFHGGKHGALIETIKSACSFCFGTTITVLGDLAAQTGLAADYERYYCSARLG